MRDDRHLTIEFRPLDAKHEGTAVILAHDGPALAAHGRAFDKETGGGLSKALNAADFKGKVRTAVEVLAHADLNIDRLIVTGAGKADDPGEGGWPALGGYILGQITARKTTAASLIAETSETGKARTAAIAAELAFGALLRHYSFRKYQTRGADAQRAEGNADAETPKRNGLTALYVHCAHPEDARAAFERHEAVANGIYLARDLVNEPANMLGPVEFADRVRELERAGLEVEILDAEAITELKMGALLCVAQGSARPARVAIMQWHGAKSKRAKPIAIVGKGVVFDSGGISIKPAAGMEDMKGDMGGAACVAGIMLALAERKANVNVVGLIGCVENMPSGTAVRPGDIVTSMSGQTIEVINTDAEGRLVLADVLWYAQERFKPRLIIDLATLTGAIMVALGKEFAGLYCNDDRLANDLLAAGKATGEKVWRMPLDKSYDKLIDSKTADMKNMGGRWAGACTAAAFIQRFIKDAPWAHIDVAGTAMDATRSEINPSWASGWGVRLLDRFIADHHEKADR